MKTTDKKDYRRKATLDMVKLFVLEGTERAMSRYNKNLEVPKVSKTKFRF